MGRRHGLAVHAGSILIVALLAAVELVHGSDVVTLAIGLGMQRSRGLDLFVPQLDRSCVGLVPELVPDAHGDSPMGHRAFGIVLRDLLEFFLRFLVPERVQQRDTAFEGLLHLRRARYREMYRAQLIGRQAFVVMALIGRSTE